MTLGLGIFLIFGAKFMTSFSRQNIEIQKTKTIRFVRIVYVLCSWEISCEKVESLESYNPLALSHAFLSRALVTICQQRNQGRQSVPKSGGGGADSKL